MWIHNKFLTSPIVGLTVCLGAFAQSNRTASGVVLSGEGLPLRGVAVSLSRLPKDGPPQVYSAATDSQGRFEAKGLAPGRYTVCLRPRAGNYLDSCVWQTRQEIDLTAADARGRFTLERGTRLLVWVRDPIGALSKPNAQFPQPIFSVADGKGAIRELLLLSKEGEGVLRYSTVVPFSQNYNVILQPGGLRLRTSKGEVATVGANFSVASRQTQEVIVEDFTLVP